MKGGCFVCLYLHYCSVACSTLYGFADRFSVHLMRLLFFSVTTLENGATRCTGKPSLAHAAQVHPSDLKREHLTKSNYNSSIYHTEQYRLLR